MDAAQKRGALLSAIGHADRVIEACEVLLKDRPEYLLSFNGFSELWNMRVRAYVNRAAATAELETVKAYPKETT